MLRSKASRWAAAPYLVWMVLFIVVPLGIVVWYALTNSDGQFTLANLTSIAGVRLGFWPQPAACGGGYHHLPGAGVPGGVFPQPAARQ